MEAYNKAYLFTEYQTAVQTAVHAAQWNKYSTRGGSLTLRTQRDGRVRNEHRFYEGATYPVGDAFWDTWYPPNGWRCRCFVVWNAEAKTVVPEALPEIVSGFGHNAGKQGTLLSDDASYFQVEAKYAKKAEGLFGMKPPIDPERVKANSELYQKLIADKKNYELIHTDNLTGGVAFAHKEHDRKDFPANKKAAMTLAGAGHGVVIREHSKADGVKSPAFEIDGARADLKTPEVLTSTSISNAFKEASKQGIETLAIDANNANESSLIEGINRGFRNRNQINNVLIIRSASVIEITRAQFTDGQVAEVIKKSRT